MLALKGNNYEIVCAKVAIKSFLAVFLLTFVMVFICFMSFLLHTMGVLVVSLAFCRVLLRNDGSWQIFRAKHLLELLELPIFAPLYDKSRLDKRCPKQNYGVCSSVG